MNNTKMKLPITDQFLLDILYPFIDATGDVLDFLLSNKYRRIKILFGNDNPVFKTYKKTKRGRQFDQLVYYLKKNNHIKVKSLEGKKTILLTKKGFSKALQASFKSQNYKKRRDKKWIMIAFDIPQKYTKARGLLRSILLNLGYKMFQQSVWVTPYDVSEKTEKLLQMHSLEKYVKIFLIEEL